MNKIKLINITVNFAIYFYYPDGGEYYGIIRINIDGNYNDENECILLLCIDDQNRYYAQKLSIKYRRN